MPNGGLDNQNRAWMWGHNNAGQIGNGNTTSKSSPVLVVGGHRFIQLTAAADENGAGLDANGQVWTWGQNSVGLGALGTNSFVGNANPTPVSVVGNHSFIQIGSVGTALKADGSVWTWSRGSNGVLGDNTTTAKSSPVSVVGNHSFIYISINSGMNGNNRGALKADGSVWMWGDNSNGELGNNSTTSKSSPVSVVDAHSFIQLKVGQSASVALKANGEAWTWGRNLNGLLGDNTSTSRSAPVSVVGAHSFIQVTTSGASSMAALKADGSVWCWGQGTVGELGDNTKTSKSSPVSVVGAHSFVAIGNVSNSNTFFGRKSNGQIWCWGNNVNNFIGDNSPTDRSSPVLVVGSIFFTGLLEEQISLSTIWTLTINATNGSVAKNPSDTTYADGTQVILTATANNGYKFISWSGSASGSVNPLTITMNADKNITANFSKKKHPFYGIFTPFFIDKGKFILDLMDGKLKRKIPS